MAEVGDPAVPGGQVDRVADKTAGGGKGEAGEGCYGNEDGASALTEVEGGQAIDLALPVRFFGERKVGGVGECFGEGEFDCRRVGVGVGAVCDCGRNRASHW